MFIEMTKNTLRKRMKFCDFIMIAGLSALLGCKSSTSRCCLTVAKSLVNFLLGDRVFSRQGQRTNSSQTRQIIFCFLLTMSRSRIISREEGRSWRTLRVGCRPTWRLFGSLHLLCVAFSSGVNPETRKQTWSCVFHET